jgi:hypothetical protein
MPFGTAKQKATINVIPMKMGIQYTEDWQQP